MSGKSRLNYYSSWAIRGIVINVTVRLPFAIALRRPASPPLVLPHDALIRAPPTELLVLAHELHGALEHLTYVLDELQAATALRAANY